MAPLLALLLLVPQPTVDVRPRLSATAPATVSVLARQHSTNEIVGRGWCLEMEGPAFYRGSCAEGGPDSVFQVYTKLPPGWYAVRFVVTYSDRHTRYAETSLCVSGGENSC